MVNELGDNLNVLILTTVGNDWRTFSTWYSIYKNLPDANIELVCERQHQVGFQMYQWAKRLNVPITYTGYLTNNPTHRRLMALNVAEERGMIGSGKKCLLVDPNVMVLDSLNNEFVTLFNQSESKIHINDNIWFINDIERSDIDNILNEYALSGNLGSKVSNSETLGAEAKDAQKPLVFTTYNKGCGRWIDTMQGCPFSNASGLVTEQVTVNEMRIIDLWRKMVSLYSAVL